jgi:F-type H+-transporting ATPase subunit b
MGLVTPNPGTIIWLVIIFGIVLYILKRFAWKPILYLLKERERSIAAALRSADKAREEVEGLKADHEKVIRETRLEKETILKEARELKSRIVMEAREKAHQETLKSIGQARMQIEREKTAALEAMKIQIAHFSIEIAEKLIRKELTAPGGQEKIVDQLINDLKLN